MTVLPEIINGMEAGKEIDALVAVRLLGLKPCTGWAYSPMMRIQASWTRTKDCPHQDGECFWVEHPVEYSQSMTVAWTLCELLHFIDLHYFRAGDYYEATFLVGEHPNERIITGAGKTAPVAICRAALLSTP